MWAWRVIVPGIGLACSLVIFSTSNRTSPSPVRVSDAALPAPQRRVIAEGRIVARPGAEVTVGSETGGTVATLYARENRPIKCGDPLLEFEPTEQKAALAEAEAKLAEIDAEIGYLTRDYERRNKSSAKTEQFASEMDASRRDREVAAARRNGALAVVDRCRLALARTKVVAPIDGMILATFVQVGEVAAPSSKLVTICNLSRVWVEAEVDEFDAGKIATGDLASIVAEGDDGKLREGIVEEVPDRLAERNLTPDDPGRPTDTSVLRVKLSVKGQLPWKLGQKVTIEIRPGK
jgi:macrolide-specific efflux system membrane fusion protein